MPKLLVDRCSKFYKETIKLFFTSKYHMELYQTYIALNAAFIARFNRTLLHIITKSMYINGYFDWINLLNKLITHKNSIYIIFFNAATP